MLQPSHQAAIPFMARTFECSPPPAYRPTSPPPLSCGVAKPLEMQRKLGMIDPRSFLERGLRHLPTFLIAVMLTGTIGASATLFTQPSKVLASFFFGYKSHVAHHMDVHASWVRDYVCGGRRGNRRASPYRGPPQPMVHHRPIHGASRPKAPSCGVAWLGGVARELIG